MHIADDHSPTASQILVAYYRFIAPVLCEVELTSFQVRFQ
jgi:hypothetical protein